MPKVVSVNIHRFPGPDTYYVGPTALDPGGQMEAAWVSPSPGILISAYPASAGPTLNTTMSRYNLVTNTVSTLTVGLTRPDYTYADRERPAWASLGGGYAQSLRIKDNNDGTATVTNWIWNDSTQTWSTGATLTIPTAYGQGKSNGLYPLSVGRTLFEHGTSAWIYTRSTNTWSSPLTMPREVWAAAQIAEDLIYFAGKRDEATGVTYSAESAESFIYDRVANTFTSLGHAIELVVPPIRAFGGNEMVVTRSGQMAKLNTGVIGIGTNSRWVTYRHDLNILSTRARTQTPYNIELLRPDPLSYALNTSTTTDYVYSY